MEWKLRKKNEIDFIDDSISNININQGINFLIGKNNSGKSKISESILNEQIEAYSNESKININKIIIKTTSTSIENENIKKEQVFENSIERFLNKHQSTEEDITEQIFGSGISEFQDEEISNFLNNKKIFQKNSFTTKIQSLIDGIPSSESGSGENRLLHMLYTISTLIKRTNEVYEEIVTKWDKFDFYLNDEAVIKNLNNESLSNTLSKLASGSRNHNGNFKEILPMHSIEHEEFYELLTFLKNIKSSHGIVNVRFLISIILNKYHFGGYGSNSEHKIIIEEFKNFFNTLDLSEDEIRYGSISKSKTLNDYNATYFEDNDGISLNFLLIIDEPELFLHSSKYKLVNKIFNLALSYANDEFDIRLLIVTHDERIIKNANKYISNVNVVSKVDGKVMAKNIFNNDINLFISNIKKVYDDKFIKIKKDHLDDKNRSEISDEVKMLSREYIEWFITYKDNIKIFFSCNPLIVEGYHDKIIMNESSLLNFDEIIESDGTYLGMLIWLELLKNNSFFFDSVQILVDADVRKGGVFKAQTHLIRNYIHEIASDSKNIKLYSSLFNDITEWAVSENLVEEWLIENSEQFDKIFDNGKTRSEFTNKEITESRDRAFEWAYDNSRDLFEKLHNLNKSKSILKNDYSKYLFSKKIKEKSYPTLWTIGERNQYLLNEKRIFSNFKEFSNFKLPSEKIDEYFFVEGNEIFSYEYIPGVSNGEKTKLDTSGWDLSQNIIVSGDFNMSKDFCDHHSYSYHALDIDNKRLFKFCIVEDSAELVDGVYQTKTHLVEEVNLEKIFENGKIPNLFKLISTDGNELFLNLEMRRWRWIENDKCEISSLNNDSNYKFIGYKTMHVEFIHDDSDTKMLDQYYYLSPMLLEHEVKSDFLIGPINRENTSYKDAITMFKNQFDIWNEK